MIAHAEQIINEFHDQGYSLTLRSLHYQFVARGLFENTQSNYDRLGTAINNARLAGLIDWEALVDHTRFPRAFLHHASPADGLEHAARNYNIDMWDNQGSYIEVWVEKDALIDVVEKAADTYDVTSFSCRGYTSQTAMFNAAVRFMKKEKEGKATYLFHLGDHDPSGIDMTKDIMKRMMMFGAQVEVRRLALTMDQVDVYNPPPNFAKEDDSRFKDYWNMYGEECWELDALDPQVIHEIITDAIEPLRNKKRWKEKVKQLKEERNEIQLKAEELRDAE